MRSSAPEAWEGLKGWVAGNFLRRQNCWGKTGRVRPLSVEGKIYWNRGSLEMTGGGWESYGAAYWELAGEKSSVFPIGACWIAFVWSRTETLVLLETGGDQYGPLSSNFGHCVD